MKTRFAPSPTGELHIGGARTALFAYLWARKHGGEFLLRIEDTDLKRSTPESVAAILDGMAWLGLDYDGEAIYQSQRFSRYAEVVQKLLAEGKAYYCDCSKQRLSDLRDELKNSGKTPKYDGKCRDKNHKSGVVRFRNFDSGEVIFDDLIKGKITINNSQLDDLIIARGDKTPTYNLTVVVDDFDMGIKLVIRGDDHINNTPRQINLYKALGWDLPQFAHLPMILGGDGQRLSKRHGAMGVMSYRDAGFLPEAMRNYLLRLGFSAADKEIFSTAEMLKLFELKTINTSPAAFNIDKLLWLNQHYIKSADPSHLIENLGWQLENQGIKTYDLDLKPIIIHLQTRVKTLFDMAKNIKMFCQDEVILDDKLGKKHLTNKPILQALSDKLTDLNNWQAEAILDIVKEVCADFEVGFGKVGQPFRIALSGDGDAGSIDIVAKLVGKKNTLLRLKNAIDF